MGIKNQSSTYLFDNQYVNYLSKHSIESEYTITTNWCINPNSLGIAKELVYNAYENYGDISIRKPRHAKTKWRVAYISNKGLNEEYYFVAKIISLFNKLSSINKVIYCSVEIISDLKKIANEGIQFIALEEKLSIETDIVLCFGSGAVHILKQALPVIIVGTHGLGGWVEEDNLDYFIRTGFKGRPGGSFDEEIPLALLAEEIVNIQYAKALNQCCKKLAKKIDKYNFPTVSELIQKQLATSISQIKSDVLKRWDLKMRLASNLTIKKRSRLIMLVRTYIDDVVASFSAEEEPFFTYLIEKRTAKEAFGKAAISMKDFWGMIDILWTKRIVILYAS
jgi:hypothetical protein